jgi:hypothetical protein
MLLLHVDPSISKSGFTNNYGTYISVHVYTCKATEVSTSYFSQFRIEPVGFGDGQFCIPDDV